jgi:hypothetical protein
MKFKLICKQKYHNQESPYSSEPIDPLFTESCCGIKIQWGIMQKWPNGYQKQEDATPEIKNDSQKM